MKPLRLKFAAAVAAIVLGLPTPVVAHLMGREESLPEVVQAATAIVQASVESEESGWHSDRWGNHIYTTYTFRAGRSAKGSVKENPFTIRVMGGQVGEVTEEVSPGWRFAVGQELVLFLRDDSEGIPRVHRAQLVKDGKVFVQGLQVPVDPFLDAIERAAADSTVDLSSLLASAASGSTTENGEPKTLPPRLLGTFLVESKPGGLGGSSSQSGAMGVAPPKSANGLGVRPMASTATIADAWWTDQVDRDADGIFHSDRLNWNPDVVGGGTLDVFEKIWFKPTLGTTWSLITTTAVHTISGTQTADSQSYLLTWTGASGLFDFGIEIYQAGATYPDYFRQPSNDLDLWAVPWEDAAHDAPPPVITSITPGKASAGTGTTVTITGTDFLPTQGNGRVDFFFQNGEPTIPAVVQSWSDTRIVCEVPVGAVLKHDGSLYPGSAGSGPVRVTTDVGKQSADYPFLVSFGFGQQSWGAGNPTVQYYVGQNLAADYVAAVQSAGGTWSSNAGIRFVLQGTTNNSVLSNNGSTEVMLGPLPPETPPGVIGQASCWGTSSVITECDLLLNSGMSWSTATPTPTGFMDVETITLHETGHWLKLLDLYGSVDGENDSAKVMYGFNPGGPTGMKRSLHADDIAGARYIYGAPVQCSYSISPTQQSFSSAGGTGNVGVYAGPGCPWNATSNVAWVTVTSGGSGTGNRTVGYSVAANSGGARSGTMTIAGRTFTVNQEAQSCSYSISPTQQSFPASGGTGSVSVTAGAGCGWTASSNVAWVTVTSGASGTGNGTVGYSVAGNTSLSRTGTMTIAGQTFTVTQATPGCSYTISPTQHSFAATGGTGSVNVTANTGCGWTASSNAAWVTITGGTSGSGNGAVNYSVAANAGAARAATLTIAGQAFAVSQDALSCSYRVDPSSAGFGAEGGGGYFAVITSAGCPWTASSGASWIHITGGYSGLGSGAVTFTVDPNDGPARSWTITVQGQTFTVSQAGQSCTYTLAPSSASFGVAGGSSSFCVSTSRGCPWEANTGATWIHLIGNRGTGGAWIYFDVDANMGPPRSATITLQSEVFAVAQAGEGNSFAFSHWIAAASHVDGVGNSHWRSDVAVLNRSSSQATVEYRLYTPDGLRTQQVSLAGNAQDFRKDIAAWLGYSAGSGSLEVRSDQDVFVMGRTYNQVDAAHTFGQNYDGQEPDVSLLSTGESAWLPLLAQNPSFRCNIAITNTGPTAASVTVTLYDGHGNELWNGNDESNIVGSGAFIQYLKPFQKYAGRNDLEHCYAKVTVNSGSGVIVWASVVDEATGDPTTIFMQTGGALMSSVSHWIGAASHVDGASSSHWRSDVAVLNRFSSPTTVEYRLYTPGGVASQQVVLAGNAQDFRKDIAAWLGYTTGSGPLEVLSSQDVFVMGRTYNQVDATHSYGQNYDGQEPDSSLLSGGESAWLPLLAQNPSFRCNIAITNPGATAANVTLTLYDGQGNQLWSGNAESSAIASGGFIQYLKPFQKYAGRNDLEHCYAKVTVEAGSGVIVWASVVDEATGDPTTIFMKR